MSFTVAHVRRRSAGAVSFAQLRAGLRASRPQRPPIAIRRPLTAREVNARLDEIARMARDLRGMSRVNPHAFAEDKNALVQAIERLQQDRRLGVAE
jgi:hypothetical protein